MASAFAAAGFEARSFELADDVLEDVMKQPCRGWLSDVIRQRRAKLIWLGVVCASWSRTRRNTTGKPGLPPPLRSSSQLWGLSGVSARDAERIKVGNAQARWALRTYEAARKAGIPFIIENPFSSMLWLLPGFRRALARDSTIVINYCSFGCAWKKPTRLLACNLHLGPLGKHVCVPRGPCLYSGQPHQVLSGYSKEHRRLWSAVASAYPHKMCQAVVKLALHQA